MAVSAWQPLFFLLSWSPSFPFAVPVPVSLFPFDVLFPFPHFFFILGGVEEIVSLGMVGGVPGAVGVGLGIGVWGDSNVFGVFVFSIPFHVFPRIISLVPVFSLPFAPRPISWCMKRRTIGRRQSRLARLAALSFFFLSDFGRRLFFRCCSTLSVHGLLDLCRRLGRVIWLFVGSRPVLYAFSLFWFSF